MNIKSIQVLGSGCSNCQKLFKLTQEATKQLGLNIEVEHINDIQKILSLGIMSTPAIRLNDKIISAGQILDVKKIKELITQ